MTTLTIPLTVRDLTLDDLPAVEWSGGTEHLTHVAEQLVRAETGDCRILGVELDSGRVIAKAGVRFAGITDPAPSGAAADRVGQIWMVSVLESWQSVGVGTLLVGALERAIVDHGGTHAILAVEHDNPRAAALYRRLGYTAYGTTLDGWPLAPGTRYVTISTLMSKPLPAGD